MLLLPGQNHRQSSLPHQGLSILLRLYNISSERVKDQHIGAPMGYFSFHIYISCLPVTEHCVHIVMYQCAYLQCVNDMHCWWYVWGQVISQVYAWLIESSYISIVHVAIYIMFCIYSLHIYIVMINTWQTNRYPNAIQENGKLIVNGWILIWMSALF